MGYAHDGLCSVTASYVQIYAISPGLKESRRQKAIAQQINVHPLTVGGGGGQGAKPDPAGILSWRMAQKRGHPQETRPRGLGVDPVSSRRHCRFWERGLVSKGNPWIPFP